MARPIFVTQSCLMFRKVTLVKAGNGFRRALGRNIRFSNLLCPRVLKIFSRSSHRLAQKVLEEVDGYGFPSMCNSPKVLDKVSVMMGYGDLPDFNENGDGRESFDVSSVHKIFPGVILGSSPPLILYDEAMDLCDIKSLLGTEATEESVNDLLSNFTRDEKIPKGHCEPLVSSDLSTALSRQKRSYMPQLPFNRVASNLDNKVHQTGTTEESFLLESQDDGTPAELFLDKPISFVPGLVMKPYYRRQLEGVGFHTLRKLLNHFPRTYADLRIAETGIEDGQYLMSVGEVLSCRGIRASISLSYLEVVVGCEIAYSESKSGIKEDNADIKRSKTIFLHLRQYYKGTRFTTTSFLHVLRQRHEEGEIVCVSGKVRHMRKDHYEMREHRIDVLQNNNDPSFHDEGRPYPIYPAKGRINPNSMSDLIRSAVQALPLRIDPIPVEVLRDFGLPNLYDAYTGIHQPKNMNEADRGKTRFIFDEFFYLQLGRLFLMLEGLGTQIEKDGLLEKFRQPECKSSSTKEWSHLTKMFVKAFPHTLTPSQLKAVSEIIWDLKQPVPMNRLLQGDVGCGKTIVAFLACIEVIGSGYQAAFMVPTELLAIQHYEHLKNLLERIEEVECRPAIALLTSSTPIKEIRMICKNLQTGVTSIVIGTHSLLSDNVEFASLRLVVVDEQHRFGVVQRGKLNRKLSSVSISAKAATETSGDTSKSDVSMAPHVLSMSATPIPRSLAMALYGDVSLTQITDLPPGRIPVETFTVEGNEAGFEKVYEIMLNDLRDGGKVYLVYPVIEQSEQLPELRGAAADYESISKKFQGYGCGLLHSRMKGDEKEEALKRFKSGETRILLSTQVIEVGVDVSDASLMIVMNAERFGIAQLHQLRGRVGRGSKKSKCIFVAAVVSSMNRLKILEKSSDGFYLANMDLLLRGPGDLVGKKQSGHLPEFPVARLEGGGNILHEAHLAALKVLSASHDLEKFPLLKMELSMRQPLSFLGD